VQNEAAPSRWTTQFKSNLAGIAILTPGTALLVVLRVHAIAPPAVYLLFAVVALVTVSGLWYRFGNVNRPHGEPMTKRESAILWPLATVTAVVLAVNFYQVAVLFSASSIFGAQQP
jgi:hypothetical protein